MHNFAHLQVHSHYTLLGGLASVMDLAKQAAVDGLTHLALTDTNALYGAIAFQKACHTFSVQPILGMTVTVTAREAVARGTDAPGRLVLLAKGPDGYSSLCRLSSLVQACPERETTAPGWEALKAHRKGLICLSGGRMGWIERYVRAGDLPTAHRYAARLAGIFGENTYLSLELHQPEDHDVAHEIVGLGQRMGLPALAVQPVFCLRPEDAPKLRLLTAIDGNCRLGEVPPSALPAHGDPNVDLHWLKPDEVALRFAAFPRAVAAVGEVTVRCEPFLPTGQPTWPAPKLPEGKTASETLADLARTGLEDRFGLDPPQAVRERLETELGAISRHGYAPLFLVVADITRFAREKKVPFGTRGSVANSLVAFCARISTVDPIAHDLLFERFLSPDRADAPDIDLNFCSRRRDEVLEYVRRSYGDDHVALVATISTMGPRSAVRETAKAYGLHDAETKRLMAALPPAWLSHRRWEPDINIENALAGLENVHWRQIVREAHGLIGQPHHLSLHPGGVVITPGPLTDLVPVQWTPKGFLATQFDQEDLKALGLPKIDLLGIRALTVLAATEKLVQRHYDPTFQLQDIPMPSSRVIPDRYQIETRSDDQEEDRTGDQLSRAETIGVFQCESTGARRTMRKLETRTVFDLAVANAFFKPAPAMGGMAQAFVRRYRGEEPATLLHPSLEPILGRTKGVLLFQEQVIRVSREVAALSWAEVHTLRRGMTSNPEEMARIHERFLVGCQMPAPRGPGLTRQQAATLWEQITAFAGFSLNQGHATAYADLSYRSAYLKANWPAAFLCARLANRGGFHHPAVYIAEVVRLGIAVRPPHINHSQMRFALELANTGQDPHPTLWMGLGQVRDLRRASVRAIVAEREGRSFSGVRDLIQRVPLQAKEVQHLIQCGALDGLGENRAALLVEAEEIRRAGSARQMAFSFARPIVPAETQAQRMAWEQQVLGQPVSVHPLELVTTRLPKHVPLGSLPERPLARVTIAGVRLPGWTGGRGFFLGDGDTFIEVQGKDFHPPPWQPLILRGRWRNDEWGTFWFRADEITQVPISDSHH
jgi:DNA polymerase-3 subunit alpha